MDEPGKGAREPREIELKLAFDPADRAGIEAHPRLAAALPERQTLISVYYDTDDRALKKAHVALRVRKKGDRYIQAIKGMNGSANLFDRPEWEHEIATSEPDFNFAAGTALEPILSDAVIAGLRPLFRTRIERTVYRLSDAGSAVEVALDAGEIEGPSRWSPVHELELELKQGGPADLFRLARSLSAGLALTLAVKTKAERGYELVENAVSGLHEKASQVLLGPAMPSAAAFRVVARSCLRQIIANAPGVCARDVEAVHQMRVGLRRLRAAVTVFGKMLADREQDRIKDELKWITNELGPARDLDVLHEDVFDKKVHPGNKDADAAAAALENRRAAAYEAAIGAVRSDRFRATLLDVAEWVEIGPWASEPELAARRERLVTEHAAKWLASNRSKIRSRGEDIRRLEPSERHKLRIRAKNLRYAVEFFESVLPQSGKAAKRREAALAALKDMQDQLGALNDIAAREALVTEAADLAGHAATLLATRDGDTDRLLGKAQSAHTRFAEVKSFWN